MHPNKELVLLEACPRKCIETEYNPHSKPKLGVREEGKDKTFFDVLPQIQKRNEDQKAVLLWTLEL